MKRRKKSYKEGILKYMPFDGNVRIPMLCLDRIIGDERSAVINAELEDNLRYASIVASGNAASYAERNSHRIIMSTGIIAISDDCIPIPKDIRYEADIGNRYTIFYNIDHIEVWDQDIYDSAHKDILLDSSRLNMLL